jgi:altronate dehydratase small subunit
MADRYIKAVEPKDNVATVIREVEEGETVEVERGEGGEVVEVDILEDIPFGHKIALEDIAEGDTIFKYGLSIGYASRDIDAGEWVHTHNVDSNYGRGDLAAEEAEAAAQE